MKKIKTVVFICIYMLTASLITADPLPVSAAAVSGGQTDDRMSKEENSESVLTM